MQQGDRSRRTDMRDKLTRTLMGTTANADMPKTGTPTSPLTGELFEEHLSYWHSLVDEKTAADFLGLSVRTLQGFRQNGRSPPFIRVSGKAIRYRRLDLWQWAEDRLATSTWEA